MGHRYSPLVFALAPKRPLAISYAGILGLDDCLKAL